MPSKLPRGTMLSSAPALLPSSGKPDTDDSISGCSEWLERQEEQEELVKKWQKIESHLIDEHRWFQLSDQECAILPEAAKLHAISERLDELYARNQRLLTKLSNGVATTPRGVACKLAVALALVHPDENKDAHRLIQSALRDAENISLKIRE